MILTYLLHQTCLQSLINYLLLKLWMLCFLVRISILQEQKGVNFHLFRHVRQDF